MPYPSAWRRYITAPSVSGDPSPECARFSARYHLASAFDGVRLNGVADATAEAYSRALGVSLAYSALEALDKATGSRGTAHIVGDERLARVYRSTGLLKLRSLLESTADTPRLRDQLEVVATDHDHANVMPVARAIRHAVFHGDFTAYGAGAARSKSVRNFLDDLKSALLDTSDAQFELYLDRQAIGPWNVDVLERCPSCKTPRGKAHGLDCSIGRCKAHGERRDQCSGDGRHAPSTYWGVYPGTIEALKRGWTYCSKAGKMPDLNRVMSELTWESQTEMYGRLTQSGQSIDATRAETS